MQATKPRGFWNEKKNHKLFFEELAKKLGIQEWKDWYKVRREDVLKNGGFSFLRNHYQNSHHRALKSLFPEYPWKDIEFLSPKYTNARDHKELLEEIGKKLGIVHFSDWYRITKQDVCNAGNAKVVLRKYHSCLPLALIELFPEHNLQLWKFENIGQAPSIPQFQIKMLEQLAGALNFSDVEEWYLVSKQSLRNLGVKFGSTYLFNLIEKVYPEIEWDPNKFIHLKGDLLKRTKNRVESGYWTKRENRRKFFDDVGKTLSIKNFEDWYQVNFAELSKLGGLGLFRYFNNSYFKAISDAYPEYNFLPWRFKAAPKNIWENKDTIKEFLLWLSKELNIQDMDDWYKITNQQLLELDRGAESLLVKYGGLVPLLSTMFPNHTWEERRLYRPKKQEYMFFMIQELFPNKDIQYNYFHPILRRSNTSQFELDVYIPSLSLGFEYQGIQHYQELRLGLQRPVELDEEKRRLCKEAGITLIEIPYWWDMTKESLIEYINKKRPGLFFC